MIVKDEYSNLLTIPTIHEVPNQKLIVIPYVLTNLSYDRIYLPKGEILGHMTPIQCEIQEGRISETQE